MGEAEADTALSPLHALPRRALLRILSFLDARDLCAVEAVDTRLHRLVVANEVLWRNVCDGSLLPLEDMDDGSGSLGGVGPAVPIKVTLPGGSSEPMVTPTAALAGNDVWGLLDALGDEDDDDASTSMSPTQEKGRPWKAWYRRIVDRSFLVDSFLGHESMQHRVAVDFDTGLMNVHLALLRRRCRGFRTVRDALAALEQRAGDDDARALKILVMPGTYSEEIRPARPVELWGLGGRDVVFTGGLEVGGERALQRMQAFLGTLAQRVRGSPTPKDDIAQATTVVHNVLFRGRGIRVLNNAVVSLAFCQVEQVDGDAIDVSGASSIHVRHCAVTDNDGCGLMLWTPGNTLTFSEVSHNEAGVRLRGEASVDAIANHIHGNRVTGLLAQLGSQLKCERSHVHGNAGVGVLVESNASANVADNDVWNNKVGIVLDNSGYTLVETNTVHSNNYEGILVRSHASGKVTGNKVYNNGQRGIVIGDTTQADDNEVFRNNCNAPLSSTKGLATPPMPKKKDKET